ncbi:TldD/PmbA family protein [Methanobrevibacter sp. UBA313]|uniref:TldD/PmbA family protein n=1 Tax=Methanobrevibacter sp. UBA313 TaxID=1915477 RepID=UPI0039B931CA
MLNQILEEAERNISKYCDEYEIFAENSKLLELDAQKSDLSFAKQEINLGIGIRVIQDNKLGFAFTSDMNKISETAEKAYSNAKLNQEDSNFAFAEKSSYPKIKNNYDKKNEELELDEMTSFMENILNTVEEKGCKPTSGGFSRGSGEEIILNSNGVKASEKSTGFGAYIAVNAFKKDEFSSAYDSISSCNYDFNGEELAEKVSQLAIDSVGGENIDTGDKEVVLDYNAATGLLNTFMSGFNADNVQRGRSILKDKVDQSIVSENLSIYDDGTIDAGLSSSKFDGEGTPSQKTELVKDGVLKGFIYDIYTANKAKIKSTGNGFRGSYSSTPGVSSSNIILDFNKMTKIDEIDNGIIATDLLGAHTANPISGDFSVEVNNGFLIENGEITKPIKKAMISGNVFETFKNCEAIDSQIKQYGSFILPKILLHNLRVIG